MGTDRSAAEQTEVLIRVRNRIIEYLELVADPDAQRQYQDAVHGVSIPCEVFNQWEDWVDMPNIESYSDPVFTQEERDAVAAYHVEWNAVADLTPDPLPPLDDLIGTPEWERLRVAAQAALRLFAVRGKFREQDAP